MKIVDTDFDGRKEYFTSIAKYLFEVITSLPKEVRNDEKERTGLKILLREIGTRNLIYISAGQPSEKALYFCNEKAVRSEVLGDFSSQNSENLSLFRFRGSVTVEINGIKYQASTSGLLSNEDVLVSVISLAVVFSTTTRFIISNIRENNGLLPYAFSEEGSYFHKLLSDF